MTAPRSESERTPRNTGNQRAAAARTARSLRRRRTTNGFMAVSYTSPHWSRPFRSYSSSAIC